MFGIFEVVRAGLSATSKLLELQVRGMGAEGNDATASVIDGVQMVEQLGVAANPVVASTLRVIGWQQGVQLWALKIFDKSKRPTGIASGEIRFHGLEKVAAALRILATGKINIDAESGQDLVLNSGTKKVGRVGDSVDLGTFLFLPNAGVAAAVLSWIPPGGGAAVIIATPLAGGSNIAGKISGPGADHVLA